MVIISHRLCLSGSNRAGRVLSASVMGRDLTAECQDRVSPAGDQIASGQRGSPGLLPRQPPIKDAIHSHRIVAKQ